MNAVVKNLMLNAVKAQGLDVDRVMLYIDEQLTPAQFKEVEAFLTWCVKNKKKFGYGNIDARIEEFKKS